MYHLETEIHAQPEVISRLLTEQHATAQTIAKAIRDYNPAFVSIAARGTSDNAGRYAQYLMGIEAHLPVALATPSIHTLYESPPNLGRALVIGISQSGRSEDIYRVMTDAREQGALTVSITNNPDSRIATAAEFHLDLLAGEEIAVAATKSYTAQVTAIAMLVAALTDKAELTESLKKLPVYASETLKQSDRMAQWVERYRYMERFAAIGRGYNYCTAFEISLKVKELNYITGLEYSEADFRHGPIAIVNPGFPVLVIATQGKTLNGLVDLLGKLTERNAECLVISNDENALSYGHNTMTIPADIPEWLSPITAVIPGQIFAMNLAIAKGLPVDSPEGLTKITDTK
ncbi:MAG: SIS domain-containing protein [Aggregatilineales bacterium]